MLIGFIDEIRPERIVGWAADPDLPNTRIELAVYVDGRDAARVVADQARDDLRQLGGYGDGRHGFILAMSPDLFPGEKHDIVVRFASTNAVLATFTLLRRMPGGNASTSQADVISSLAKQPRYVIHVGQPKTGTTYMQHLFHQFRNQMLEDGILYPTEWWQPIQNFAHHELVHEIEMGQNPKLENIFAKLNASSHRTVLISCEGFCMSSKAGLNYLRRLIGENPVEIVFYARRWSDLIPSHWQHRVKQGARETFPEFYSNTLNGADDNQLINQRIALDRFAESFGDNSLRIVSYSNLQDHGQDIASHFFRQVLNWNRDLALPEDVAFDTPDLLILRRRLVHESMGALLTELIRCLNALWSEQSDEADSPLFDAYERVRNDRRVRKDIQLIFAAMKKHMGECRIDDDAPVLRSIFARMSDAYGDRLVSREFGADFFKKQSKKFNYVKPDFLLEDGVVTALHRVQVAVTRQIDASHMRAAQ